MKLTVISFLLIIAATESSGFKLPDAATRTYQTLQGLFEYYWTHDPQSKNIGFFFACGQIGGWGTPAQWNKCGCSNPNGCSDCYRWWDAVALESIANYGIYTNTKDHTNVADQIFAHSPYNGGWAGTFTYIDDFVWYGIAYLRVYEWLKVLYIYSS